MDQWPAQVGPLRSTRLAPRLERARARLESSASTTDTDVSGGGGGGGAEPTPLHRCAPEPRGLLHKQLYAAATATATTLSKSQQPKQAHRQTAQANLYRPPAIIKQLNDKHRAQTHYYLPARAAPPTTPPTTRHAHLGSAGDAAAAAADQLPAAARAQRKMLAFFYIYAIVVASLFLTYVAYCFAQSHLWRRQQHQLRSASLHSSSSAGGGGPDEPSRAAAAATTDLSAASQLEQQRIESKLALLERYVEIMAADLEDTKTRLREREKCRCSLGCSFNQTNYEDGASWRGQQCDNCTCKSGKIICTPVRCPKLSCDLAEQAEVSGKCCPVCMKRCKHNNSFLKHNQVFYPPAEAAAAAAKNGARKQCKCQDGLIKCEPHTSPKPRTL